MLQKPGCPGAGGPSDITCHPGFSSEYSVEGHRHSSPVASGAQLCHPSEKARQLVGQGQVEGMRGSKGSLVRPKDGGPTVWGRKPGDLRDPVS